MRRREGEGEEAEHIYRSFRKATLAHVSGAGREGAGFVV